MIAVNLRGNGLADKEIHRIGRMDIQSTFTRGNIYLVGNAYG